MFSLKGKTAVVTGGSRGIGEAIAIKMAESGADIALVYASNDKKTQEVANKIKSMGRKAIAYKCDVSKDEEVKELIKKIINDFEAIDILVNNAGITDDGLAFNMAFDTFNKVIQVNLLGTFNMIHHCYLNFIRNKKGRIINISSVIGLCGNAGQSNYASSKAGIIGLSKSIAKELAPKNVTCNVIAPGFIDTDMTKDLKKKESILNNIYLKRFGTSDDVAATAVFLASDEAAYITGEVIKVDGGLIL